MKRMFVLLFCICLLLCGCVSQVPETSGVDGEILPGEEGQEVSQAQAETAA